MARFIKVSSAKLQGLPKLLEDLEGGAFVVIQHAGRNFITLAEEDLAIPFVITTTDGKMVNVIPGEHMASLQLLLANANIITDSETQHALGTEGTPRKAGGDVEVKPKTASRRPKSVR
jgi:hypothetical protein